MLGVLARRAFTAAAVSVAIIAIGLAAAFVLRARGLDADARAAAIGEVASRTETAETLAGQAIVFALDARAGVVDEASAVTARARLEDGIVALRRVGAPPALAGGVAAFVESGERTVSELRRGEVDLARERFSDELVPLRSELTDGASAELASLAAASSATDRAAELVLWAAAITAAVLLGSALVGGMLAVARSRGRHEETAAQSVEPHIVITLPGGANDLPMRRRMPKVEDLGWLLDQILVPFAARGWQVDVTCPDVGVDCDPADVREMMASMLVRAESAGAERIGIVVKSSSGRVKIIVADDGPSVFGADGNAVGTEPVQLRSAVRTRAEAAGATLRWSRVDDLNVGVLELPRLDRAEISAVV